MKPTLALSPLLTLVVLITSCSIKAGTASPDPDDLLRDDIFVLSLPDINPEEYLQLFDYDQQAALDIKEISSSQYERGVTVYDISYASTNESRVPAYLIVPAGQGPFAGIVLMHGGARSSSREDFLWIGSQYAKYGAVVVIIDGPWNRPEFGPGLVPARSSPTPQTFTEYDRDEQIQLITDLRRAVDLLITRSDVDAERIAYIGVSYGGAMGGLLAGVEDRIQAYVLVVGDGGLVAHYSDPYELVTWPVGPFYRLNEEDQQRWLEAMWPIEPIHYVDRASPAALLYQNGTNDSAVPPFDAYRFQEAGSKPKDIIWYESNHNLPWRADLDRLIWLQDFIGSDDLIFMTPNYRPSARIIDLLVLVWLILTTIGIIIALWSFFSNRQGVWWVNLIWILVIMIFGPLGFIGYLASYRQPEASNIPWRRALGAAMYSLVAYVIIFLLLLVIVINAQPDPHPIVNLIFLIVVPILIGLLVFRAPLLVSRSGISYSMAIKRSLILEVISANSAMAGMLVAALLLLNLWIIPYDLTLRSANFWILIVLTAFAGIICNYPFNFWMSRKGYTSWPGTPAGDEDLSAVPTLRKTWFALLLSFSMLILANGLNFL